MKFLSKLGSHRIFGQFTISPKDRRFHTQNLTPASVLIFRCCRLSSLLCLYCGLWNLCFPYVCGPCRHALGLCLMCPVCVPCTGDFEIFGKNPYMASVPVLYWRLWDFRKKSMYGFPLCVSLLGTLILQYKIPTRISLCLWALCWEIDHFAKIPILKYVFFHFVNLKALQKRAFSFFKLENRFKNLLFFIL